MNHDSLNEPDRSDISKSITGKYNLAFFIISVAILLSLLFHFLPINRFRNSLDRTKKIYYADNITPAHRKIIDRFNQKYKGKIEVVPVELPFSKFNTNERKELIARTLRNRNSRIDIFAVDQIWVYRFAKWAEPLSRYFSSKERSQILEPALHTCYYNNILVGIPLHIDIGALFYRRDILQRMPDFTQLEQRLQESISWDEFIQLNNRISSSSPFFVFQGDSYEGLICNFLEILGKREKAIIENDTLRLTQPEVIQGCQMMIDLIYKHSLTPRIVTTFNESASYEYALNNDVPFFRGWPTFLHEINSYPENKRRNASLGIAPLPHSAGKSPASVFGGWNLMISKHSAEKDEAVLFLKYVLSEEAQKILLRTSGFLPVLKSSYEDQSLISENKQLLVFKQLLDNGIHRPMHPNYTKMSDILSMQIHKALNGEISAEQALTLAEEMIRTNNLIESVE
ncbi:extracellular solute-binding protein [candidate division KSB1 bacterium]|nr:extracellular solute-binding protein [candidate division KSB1 bacterium]